MIEPYWRDDPDAPFAAMLNTIDHFCHPEAHDEAFDELVELVHRDAPPEWIVRFKNELQRVLSGNTEGLDSDAVFTAASYDDGSDDAYLRRLWNELYPDEPAPQRPAGQGSI